MSGYNAIRYGIKTRTHPPHENSRKVAGQHRRMHRLIAPPGTAERDFYKLNRYRHSPEIFQVQEKAPVLGQSLTKQPPKERASHLRQCGIDVQILLVKGISKRTAWGIVQLFRLPEQVTKFLSYHRQACHRFKFFGLGLVYLSNGR